MKETVRSVTITSLDDDNNVSPPRPTRPKSPKPTLRRPHASHSYYSPRANSLDRPIGRLWRSNSHTTPVTAASTKRLARTAHLHEVQHTMRRRPKVGRDDREDSSEGDPDQFGTPKRHQNFKTVVREQVCQASSNNGADSWVDTEPGSEVGFDESESDSTQKTQLRSASDGFGDSV